MKKILLAIFIFSATSCFAQQRSVNIIPSPAKAEIKNGNFMINPSTRIVLEASGAEKSADFFNHYLKEYYGFELPVVKRNSEIKNAIVLNYDRLDNTLPGAYEMNIDNDKVYIGGDNEEGVFYGIQTLIQLLPVEKSNNLTIQQCSIADSPRFAYRGLHLDCGRHFFSVDFVKQYIDFIALHKMNTFHWHLTEDQGWRIEIKKYPKLTAVGSCRNGTAIGRNKGNDSIKYCGYYTQEQIKEVVKYAADRYITIIPEIELPGHSSAALTAYPYLGCTKGPYQVQWKWGVFNDVFCAGNDSTFQFLEDVLDEVIGLFPSKYIHIGGDECPKTSWKACPKCQARIKAEGLKDEHALQSYFIQRIEKYINSKGRQIIGWDEILEGGLAPNATVMSWRGEEGGINAAKQNHAVIMTPGNYVYLDHAEKKNEDSLTIGGYLPLETVYNYEPVPQQLSSDEGRYILGAQANVWTEYMNNVSKVEYMIFPRLSALSEVLWSPKENRNWNDFQKRLLEQFKRYELWKANYSKAYYDLKASVVASKDYNGVLLNLESNYKNGKIIVNSTALNSSLEYSTPLLVKDNSEIQAKLIADSTIISSIKKTFSFNKATGKKITVTNSPSTYFSKDANEFYLVDGLKAPDDAGYSASEWTLWETGKDLEATIDLNKSESIHQVIVDILPSLSNFIKIPQQVDIYTSADGNEWNMAASLKNENEQWNHSRHITLSFGQTEAQFVKLRVYNQPVPGAENRGGIFVDEIEIN